MEKSNKRKTVIINKKFQYRMILKFIMINIALILLFCGLLYMFLNSEIEANLQSAHVTYKNVKEMLFPIVISLSIITILISSIIITIVIIYASFKIAGPLYRFNEALRSMTNKNLRPHTSIRAHDQLYDCSIALTDFSKTISSDFSAINIKIDELKELTAKGAPKNKISGKIKELENITRQYQY